MHPSLMNKLQKMRDLCGFPFKINSGFRCPDYNEKISSTGRTGPHTKGRAVDIGVEGTKAYLVVDAAYEVGMTGIGFQQKGGGRFIHVDDLTTPPRPNVWSY